MIIISSERIPIFIWSEERIENAIEDAMRLVSLPFIFKQLCLMADYHKGYALPIGGVMACNRVVMPYAVGYDISCGMLAFQTNLTVNDLNDKTIRIAIENEIRDRIPMGRNHHKNSRDWTEFETAPLSIPVIKREFESAHYQLGTLGGGNHFIEIQADTSDNVWVMIHSGSRNFGWKICNEYHKIAKELCTKWLSKLPSDDAAFLPIETREAKEYIEAMNYAMRFAAQSRFVMSKIIESVLINVFGGIKIVKFGEQIHINHNYARWESHFGKDVLVHRKGATSARDGEFGIIPGSQGSNSYIVKGKGNQKSFQSCSHGAGRRMSRTDAKKNLNLEEQINLLNNKGIHHSLTCIKDLEEAEGAYKDIDVVMKNQEDLVDIVVKLRPLIAIKELSEEKEIKNE